MALLIVFVGLPASGKSFHIRKLVVDGAIRSDCAFEDFQRGARNDSPRPEDSRHLAPIAEHLRQGRDCATADIAFCLADKRRDFVEVVRRRAPNATIDFRYFENAPEACLRNAIRDGGPDVLHRMKMIDVLTGRYRIPPGTRPITVYTDSTRSSRAIRGLAADPTGAKET